MFHLQIRANRWWCMA